MKNMNDKIKVLLYGSNGAGKTIFNATLYHAINVYFTDRSFWFSTQESKNYFLEISNVLEENGWDEDKILENIKSTRDYAGNFDAIYEYNKNQYVIENPDYKGEDVLYEEREVFNIVSNTDSFIVLIDINSNLNGKFLNSRSIEGFKNLAKKLKSQKSYDIAIVFTKVDLLKDVTSYLEMTEYTKNIEEKLKSIFVNINYYVFYLSCQKYWHLFKMNQEELDKSLKSPSSAYNKEFHKITEPFFWVIDQNINRLGEKKVEKLRIELRETKSILNNSINTTLYKIDAVLNNQNSNIKSIQSQIEQLGFIKNDLLTIKHNAAASEDIIYLKDLIQKVNYRDKNADIYITEYNDEINRIGSQKSFYELYSSYIWFFIIAIIIFCFFAFKQCQNSSEDANTEEVTEVTTEVVSDNNKENTGITKVDNNDYNSESTANTDITTESPTTDIIVDSDNDGDGITNDRDKCPDVAGSFIAQGCPDRDGDGVMDIDDKCPDVPGPVSNKGCPEVKEEVRKRLAFSARNIQFEPYKSDIKPMSYKILDEVASILKEYPYYDINVDGHSDENEGVYPEKALKLSQDRAAAAVNYLVNKGVPASRIVSAGYGDSKPVSDNSTVAGKAQNRRVEFNLLFK